MDLVQTEQGHQQEADSGPTLDNITRLDTQAAIRPHTLFEHTPLDDASTQIRLLRFESGPHQDCIECTLEVFYSNNAPPYAAVSYMCGSLVPGHTIFVNQKEYTVGGNCLQALSQARVVCKQEYIWMDSICIHQQDLVEKSRQVQMMGQIYERAACVLPSLGPHADDSEFVVSIARQLDALTGVPTRQWMTQGLVSRNNIQRLQMAFLNLARRPYWSRVWIVQEVYMAHDVEFMVGFDTLTWSSLMAIFATREPFPGPEREAGWAVQIELRDNLFSRVVMARYRRDEFSRNNGRPYLKLYQAVERFASAMCSDPRDRMYALLSMVAWPDNVDPLVPDYTQSAFTLATKAVQFLHGDTVPPIASGYFSAKYLLTALGIDSEQADVIAGTTSRRSPAKVEAPSSPSCHEIRKPHDSKNGASEPLEFLISHDQWCRIEADDDGRPFVYLRCGKDSAKYTLVTSSVSDNEGGELLRPGRGISYTTRLKPIACYRALKDRASIAPANASTGSQITAGFFTAAVRPGDFLSLLNYGEDDAARNIGLILREHDEGGFELVGQALLKDRYELCPSGTWCTCGPNDSCMHPLRRYDLVIHFDRDDLLIFVGQDMAGSERKQCRRYFERLNTPITREALSSYAVAVAIDETLVLQQASQHQRVSYMRRQRLAPQQSALSTGLLANTPKPGPLA